jgi:hypothetical protein
MTDHGGVTSTPPAADPGATVPVATLARERRRGRFSVRDVALSLGVLIVPIFVVILGYQALGADPVTKVDSGQAYSDAQAGGQFTPLRAQGLPKGWDTTAADFQVAKGIATLRIGFVAPDGRFARFAQSNRPVEQMIADELGGARRSTGAEELNGQVWLRYPGRGQEHALVSARRDSVVVVTGTADDAELQDLAASLR